jgi:DNA-binding IclR family transcriptional regulator
MMNSGSGGAGEVGAVRKALEILCAFNAAQPEFSVSELSRRLAIPKSTAHNLLKTLGNLDFLEQDPIDRRYRLGPRVFELGLRFSRSARMVAAAMPHLEKLATQTRETVKLGVLSCDEILIVAAVESPHQLHTRGDVGARAALHCTGLGKAILAAMDPAEVVAIVARRGLRRFTPRTIGSAEQLARELAETRAAGHTVDRQENEPGVVCVAAAIGGGVPAVPGVAAISVSGPASRLGDDQVANCARLLLRAVRSVETALGAGPPAPWSLTEEGRRRR